MYWLQTQMALLDAAHGVASFAANWLLQSTLLIVVGLAVARLARRRGSASQSAIYRTTLAAIVVCPLATLLLSLNGVSGWSLPMPASWHYRELESPPLETPDEAAAVVASQVSDTDRGDFAGRGRQHWDQRAFERRPDELWPAASRVAPLAGAALPSAGRPEPVDISATETSGAKSTATVHVPVAVFEVFAFAFVAIAISVAWMMGTMLLVMRLALAWRRLRGMLRRAMPADSAVQEACRQAATLVGVSAPVVLRSPFVTSPCLAPLPVRDLIASAFCRERPLWRSANDGATSTRAARNATEATEGVPYRPSDEQPGLVGRPRAAILLPEVSQALPLRDVLIHELAHLRRGDAGWNLIARLTEALFFFQPLIWLLSRRLEASAEDVCDDYVVQFGGDRSQYARGLLEIAELATTPIGATAVAMVSLRSILARRITRILDPSRSLSTRAGNLLLALVIAGGLAGATVVGFVGLGSHPPAVAEPVPEAAAEPQAAPADDKPSDADGRAADTKKDDDKNQTAASNELHGTVIGSDGKPVAGAKLYWIRARVHDLKPEPAHLLATTDKDGSYHFVEPAPVDPSLPASWSYMDHIVITAPGHGFALTSSAELRRDMAPPDGILATVAGLMAGRASGTTRLPAAGEPVRGRLIDVNGQPVSGATVRVRWFGGERDRFELLKEAEARDAEYAVWQARVALLLNVIEPVQLRDVLPSATTDAAGRFELRDIGAKRLVQLLVQGEGIESSEIVARNEPGNNIVIEPDVNRPGNLTIYPNEFVHAVGPSKPVDGRVLDLDSGEPIAGAVVRAFEVHNEPIMTSRERQHFAATTDAQGRYRVAGLPIGKGNKLVAFGTGKGAYLPVAHRADNSAEGAAIGLDFRLKRGVWAEGRVFDAESQKPFTGEISYYFFRNRELEEAIPGLRDAYVDGVYWTNANGQFRVPVLPGRGIMAFRYEGRDREGDGIDHFPRGFGADEITGSEKFGAGKQFPTEPHYLIPGNYERVAEVAPAAGQETIHVDMPLFASHPVVVRVVDPQGQPVVQFQAYGPNERWGWQNQEGPEFKIDDLRPGERRKVFVFQRDRNLSGGGFVEYGAEQTVEIKLVTAGGVRGRLVDADGAPIDDATLSVNLEKLRSGDNSAIWARHPDLQANPEKIPVDKEGRFQLDGLIPGWTYHAHASAPRPLQGQIMNIIIGSPLKGVQVEAGENKDLGDLAIGADKPGSAKDLKADDGRQAGKPDLHDAPDNEIHGRVVEPDGKPVADARVRVFRTYYLMANGGAADAAPAPEWLAETHSDANGRFSADFEPLSPAAESQARSRGFLPSIGLIATAKGCGFGLEYAEPSANKETTLRLPRDSSPIEGRLLDLEGRPVRGARVRVRALAMFGDEPQRIDDWLAEIRARGAAKQDGNEVPNGARIVQFDSFFDPFPAPTTDDDGRFTVTGIGADRVAYLEVEGPKIATTWLPVVTRPIEPLPLTSGVLRFPAQICYLRFSTQTCYGARCQIVAVPEQPIHGVVRDADTGQPLPDTEVRIDWNDNAFTQRGLATKTDAEGRYRLSGLPKPPDEGREVELRVVPAAGQPYFRTEVKVPRRRGIDAVTCDVPLRRGVALGGRVTDGKTGQPVRAAVRYYPFLTNQAAAQYANFEPGVRKLQSDDDRYLTDAEGRFVVPAVRGRGVLTVVAEQGDRYTLAEGADAIADLSLPDQRQLNVYHLMGLNQDNAVREVDIPADAMEFAFDVRLAPLPVTRLLLVDRDGNEISGVKTQGLAPVNPFPNHWSHKWRDPLAQASAELVGPEAGETRETLFLDRAGNLGAMVRFTSESIGGERTKRIVLQPCGSIRGRIVDASGMPVAGAWVNGQVVPGGDGIPAKENMQTALRDRRFAWRLRVSQVQAGADGRFEMKGVPPGARYAVEAYVEKRDEKWHAITGEVVSGETADAGDLAPKEPQAADGNQTGGGDQRSSAVAAPNQQVNDDLITVSGTVVDPLGKPVAGAKLYAVRWYWKPHVARPPLVETTSDARGHFTISYRKFTADLGREDQWKEVAIVATADGLGAAWVTWRDLPRGQEATLRLVSDDVPIVGRVVDLEGKPVAGVTVRVGSILAGKGGNLDDWLAAVRRGELLWTAAKHLDDEPPQFDGWPPPVVTGKDGRFRITGLGRERRVQLSFSSPKIAYQEIEAVTRRSDMLPLKLSPEARGWGLAGMVHGAEFELVAPPTQPITGIVRDAETRQPLADVSIESNVFAGNNSIYLRRLRATSDANGRYRLVGMPKGAGNRIMAVPDDDQPYLMRDVEVPESRGLEPVQLDVELHRGIWITGRITNLRTGEPVVAQLHYLPFLSNEYAQKTPEFGKPRTPDGFDTRYISRADGSYRLVGLPGRAIVGAECAIGQYCQGVGAEHIAGMNEQGDFDTYPYPIMPGKKWPNAMKEINPPPGTETIRCDLALDPGGKIKINVADRDGKPVDGLEVQGSVQACYDSHDLHGSFDAITLAPDETRTVIIRHKGSKLGKVIRVRLAEHPSGSLSVTVEPTARIIGRLVDRQGAPLSGAAITAMVSPRPPQGFGDTLRPATTDGDGRFEYTDIPTGCHYDLNAQAVGVKPPGLFAKDLSIEPGETKDLGDVVYGSAVERNRQSSTKVKAAEKVAGDKMQAQRKPNLRGRVLLPDGKPAAGAELYWVRIASSQPRSAMKVDKRGATDADGRFQFALAPSDLPATPAPISLVAHKTGFGVAWQEIARDGLPHDVTLQLVEDMAIRGHLVDTEGRPVARALVSVGGLLAPSDGTLDAFLLAWKQDWQFSWTKLDRPGGLHAPLGASLSVMTDRDGRFALLGVGAERVATLDIKANGYAYDQLHVVTRTNFDPQPYNDAARSLLREPPAPVRGWIAKLAAPEFEHVATAEMIVRGKVFTGDREPVAGANVSLLSFGYAPGVSAVTDAAGRYELHGQPRGKWAGVSVYAPEPAGLLGRLLQRETTPTQSTLKIDVKLNRGVVLAGRVFDRSTGKGVRASLRFVPLPDNDFVDDDGNEDPTAATNDAGEYRLLVMPGPGVLMAQAHDGPRVEGRQIVPYRQASFSKDDSQRVPTAVDGDDRYFTGRDNTIESLLAENAVKVVEVKPDGGPARCDLALDPGKTVKITIEDDEGQPRTRAGGRDNADRRRAGASHGSTGGLGQDQRTRVGPRWPAVGRRMGADQLRSPQRLRPSTRFGFAARSAQDRRGWPVSRGQHCAWRALWA